MTADDSSSRSNLIVLLYTGSSLPTLCMSDCYLHIMQSANAANIHNRASDSCLMLDYMRVINVRIIIIYTLVYIMPKGYYYYLKLQS